MEVLSWSTRHHNNQIVPPLTIGLEHTEWVEESERERDSESKKRERNDDVKKEEGIVLNWDKEEKRAKLRK